MMTKERALHLPQDLMYAFSSSDINTYTHKLTNKQTKQNMLYKLMTTQRAVAR